MDGGKISRFLNRIFLARDRVPARRREMERRKVGRKIFHVVRDLRKDEIKMTVYRR